MFPFRRRNHNNNDTTTIIKPTTNSKPIRSSTRQTPSNRDRQQPQYDSSGHWTATTTTTTTTESSVECTSTSQYHPDDPSTDNTDIPATMTNNNNNNNITIITDTAHVEIEEMIRFGTAFGFAMEKTNNNNTKSEDPTSSESSSSTTTTTTTATMLPKLSDEAQRYYDTFQQWKAQHASYLYRPPCHDDGITTTTGNTPGTIALTNHCRTGICTSTSATSNHAISSHPEFQQQQHDDRMDELDWYNSLQYAIQYHLLNNDNNNNNVDTSSQPIQSQYDDSHHHFRIIATPPTTIVTNRMKQSTKSSTHLQFTLQCRRNHILYVLPAGMNISTVPKMLLSSSNDTTWNTNHHHHHNNNNNNNKKDVTKQMMDVYTTAFAIYIYRTLFVIPNHMRNTTISNNNDGGVSNNPTTTFLSPIHVTIVLDVRKGGPHWPNIPAIQFISFIRHVGTILPFYFPGICTQCILYPIPAMACTLYHLCIKPILDKNIQQLIHLVTTTTAMKVNNDNDDDDDTCKVNYQRLEEFRMQIIQTTPGTTTNNGPS